MKINVIAVTLFILSIAPLVWIGMYARASMDDYSFAASSSFYHHMQWWDIERDNINHNYFERSVRYATLNGNVFDVLRNVFRTVADNYREWQGTFSAIALFSLQPAVLFGFGGYPLVMLVTLVPLIVSTLFLVKTLVSQFYSSSKEWLILSFVLVTICIQFMPHVGQGLFWYNGAIFYTFFFSLMLVSIGLKVRCMTKIAKSTKILPVILIALLDFFIAGGNLVTALLLVEINILITIGIRKKTPLIFLISSALGLFLNVIAPGNVIRSGGFGGFDYVITTIIMSLQTAVMDIIQWTTIPVIFLLLLSIPFMILIVSAKGNKFKFRFPLLVVIITFLLFASQNAPPFFGMEDSGPPRLRNIVYFSYVWLIFGNTLYVIGWVKQKFFSATDLSIIFHLSPQKVYIYSTVILLVVIFLGYQHSSSYMAFRDISTGRATEFLQQHQERQAILNSNPEDGIVRINAFYNPPLTLIPWWDGILPLLDTEVSINSSGFVNRAMADFYGLVAVYSNPPRETVAMPVPTYFSFEGRVVSLETYLINWNRHIRLRDLALFLNHVFDVQTINNQLIINIGDNYTFEGNENKPLEEGNQAAFLNSEKMLVLDSTSGSEYLNVVSYIVNNDMFHQLRDVLEAIYMDFEFRDGIIYLAPITQ